MKPFWPSAAMYFSFFVRGDPLDVKMRTIFDQTTVDKSV
jgi:hypothetical protein